MKFWLLFSSGYVRIALLLIAFSTFQDNYVLSATCYIVSFLLDEVDGRVARYLGQSKWVFHIGMNLFFFLCTLTMCKRRHYENKPI